MGPGRLAAVADTGPLIHLAEIGCLPLLTRELYTESSLFVTQTIVDLAIESLGE